MQCIARDECQDDSVYGPLEPACISQEPAPDILSFYFALFLGRDRSSTMQAGMQFKHTFTYQKIVLNKWQLARNTTLGDLGGYAGCVPPGMERTSKNLWQGAIIKVCLQSASLNQSASCTDGDAERLIGKDGHAERLHSVMKRNTNLFRQTLYSMRIRQSPFSIRQSSFSIHQSPFKIRQSSFSICFQYLSVSFQ